MIKEATTMMNQKCNGWTNRATWIANVWMSNDEGMYRYWNSAAAQCDSIDELTAMMELELHDMAPQLDNMYGDLLEAILEQVEWYEIAEEWWNEAHCA